MNTLNRKLLSKNAPLTTQSLPPSQPPNAKQPLISLTSFDCLIILTILFLVTIFLISLYSFYIRRFSTPDPLVISRLRTQLVGPTSSHGLDMSTVQSLPIFGYDGNAKEAVYCSVCLSEFEEKETVKLIPNCGHVYHSECIDKWFVSHVSCPLCRSIELFKKDTVVVLECELLEHSRERE
ncbi:hypothetical protein IFM89_024129 [Coptis chinensis]|uniref:RING-type E3 ubiquitin transferase n=1 Tax=Coptis chinensis TaxID=261450 RepID=A0A835H4W6_9MAGN|nr:hypothetical protein IFM89_024129 [Coptis chinensis]